MSKRVRDNEDVDNKRARVDNNKTVPSRLFQYSFLIPLVIQYLTDRNVLTRLLPTCRSIKPFLLHYPLKQSVKPEQAALISDLSRYLPVTITRLRDVNEEDISIYPHLRSVEYLEYGGTIKAPEWVTEISTSSSWDQALTCGMFPAGLKRLNLGDGFNQILKPGVLPSMITHLFLGNSFNKLIAANALPPSLIELQTGECFGRRIDPGVLPDTLEHFSMGWGNSTHLKIGCLPKSLKHLQSGDGLVDAGAFPDSITHLRFDPFYLSDGRSKIQLPLSLTHLGSSDPEIFDAVDRNFPASLTHLVLNGGADPPMPPTEPGDIPSTVTYLSLIHRARPGAIPNSVTHLEIVESHRSPLQIGVIPNSVTTLSFGSQFRDQLLLPGVIPSSVITLSLGDYNKPLQQNVIPDSVTSLAFGDRFNQLLLPCVIPPSVKKLTFHGPFKKPLMSLEMPYVPTVAQSSCIGCPSHCHVSSVTLRSIPDSVVDLRCRWPPGVTVPVGDIPISVKKLSFGRSDCQRSTLCKCTSFKLVPGSIPSSVTS